MSSDAEEQIEKLRQATSKPKTTFSAQFREILFRGLIRLEKLRHARVGRYVGLAVAHIVWSWNNPLQAFMPVFFKRREGYGLWPEKCLI